jgi:hypothetical protein
MFAAWGSKSEKGAHRPAWLTPIHLLLSQPFCKSAKCEARWNPPNIGGLSINDYVHLMDLFNKGGRNHVA